MKTLRSLIAILLATPVVRVSVIQAQAAMVVTTVRGLPCEGLERRADGSPKRCVLARDQDVGLGVIPAGSEARFDPAGTLRSLRLSRAAAIYGTPLPARATLHFTSEVLRMFWLHDDATIQGHTIQGHEDGVGNTLYPNGKLRAIWLAHDEEIDGVPCTSSGNVFRMGFRVIHLGTDRMVYFGEDGHLHQAMLSRDITVGGRRYNKGDVVTVARDGQLAVIR